jgi:kanamycin kinase
VTIPTEPLPVPAVVAGIAEGRAVRAVWRNELGGVTFSIGDGSTPAEFVKTGPDDFAAEAVRLAWAGRYIAVPLVLGVGDSWLHTAGLPGRSAVDRRWADDPGCAARAIGAGLRILHDALPVGDCPFDWSVQARLARVPAAVRGGLTDPPSIDRLVVCHGDACAPNTMIDDAGRCCGHVDFGSLGIADRWADLAVATMSLDWNYGGFWEDDLLQAYGIEPDAVRIEYYRRLWNAPEIDCG